MTDQQAGEWAQPDPADVAAYDERMAAYAAQETARQQEKDAAEERRQVMLAGDGARTAEATSRWHDARAARQAAALEFTSLAEQWQRGQRAAEMEAGS